MLLNLLLTFTLLHHNSSLLSQEIGSDTSRYRNFLLIYTKNANSQRNKEFYAGFASYLSNNKVESSIRTMNLNSDGTKSFEKMLEVLQRAVNISHILSSYYNTIIATDSEAHRLIGSLGQKISTSHGVVSVVAEGADVKPIDGVSIISTRLFFRENFHLALRLFPETKNIIVITDSSPYGVVERSIAGSQLGRAKEQVKITYLSPNDFSSFHEFIYNIKSFPKRTAIILSSWSIDSFGNYKINNEYFPFLSQLEEYPIFASQNLMVGSGVIGGYTVSTWDIGYKVAEISNSLNNTTIIDTIKTSKLIFDYNVLNRWNLAVREMPKGSVIINKPDGLLDNYSIEINFIIVIFSLLTFAMFLFVLYHFRYRKLAEENMHLARDNIKKNEYLNLALESANSYTWTYNSADNRFEYDKNFYKITGIDNSLFTSLDDFLTLVHPDDKLLFVSRHSQGNLQNNGGFSLEYRLKSGSEEVYEWWERRGITHSNSPNQEESFTVYGMDFNVNNHKKRENELMEAIERAEQADKLKTAFLSNMSHEIRTPLNGIVGFAALMSDNSYDSEQKRQFAEIISENSSALMALVNDVLDLSKIDSNSITFQMASVSLKDQIFEVVKLMENQFGGKVKLNISVPQKDLFVWCDSMRNQQILSILLENTLKHLTQGEVTIGFTEKRGFAEIFIYDNGPGLSKEHLKNIFNRFYKADNFKPGLGLGLPICKALVERFGGQISAESKEGAGLKITYTLPLAKRNTDNTDQITPVAPVAIEQKQRPLILVAEDMESNFLLLKVILSQKYDIIWAKDGEEAIKLYKEHNPDLILMDIKMPVMDGLEATRTIREISATTPILAQTANAFENDHKRAREAGCNDVITKPIKTTHLLNTIAKYI